MIPMVIEAAVALWSAYVAKSITLLAFGLDSVIELISAGVLVWRLTATVNRFLRKPTAARARSAALCCLRLPPLW